MMKMEALDTSSVSVVASEWLDLVTVELAVSDYVTTVPIGITGTEWIGQVRVPYLTDPDKLRTTVIELKSTDWVQYGLIRYNYPDQDALRTDQLTVKNTSWS